jgi:hypothetical protein
MKGCGRGQSKRTFSERLEKLRKTTKNLLQNSWCSGTDLNPLSPEYGA